MSTQPIATPVVNGREVATSPSFLVHDDFPWRNSRTTIFTRVTNILKKDLTSCAHTPFPPNAGTPGSRLRRTTHAGEKTARPRRRCFPAALAKTSTSICLRMGLHRCLREDGRQPHQQQKKTRWKEQVCACLQARGSDDSMGSSGD